MKLIAALRAMICVMRVSIPFFVHYKQSFDIDLFSVQCLAALSYYAELSMG